MARFRTNQDVERLLHNYYANIELVERMARHPNREEVLEANVHNDMDTYQVRGNAETVANHAVASILNFRHLFEDSGLSKDTWKSYMGQFYNTLLDQAKEPVRQRVIRNGYVRREALEDERVSEYAHAIAGKADLEAILARPNFTEQDIEPIKRHFIEEIEIDGETVVGVQGPISAAIDDYRNNELSVRKLMEMRGRVYDVLRKGTLKKAAKHIDRLVTSYDPRDSGIGNYARASIVKNQYDALRQAA